MKLRQKGFSLLEREGRTETLDVSLRVRDKRAAIAFKRR
jgi:hypothetical protein